MGQVPMTLEGVSKLRQELHVLKTEARIKVIQAIAEARGHGDLKENAEYHAAKEQQGFIEGRIAHIEQQLSQAQIIDVKNIPNTGKVIFGVTVLISNLDTDEQYRYAIVGEDEADLKAGKISINSPLARGMIGKQTGDTVEIQTPGGLVVYEIMSVEHL
jgi:transcription elongation factor GreA